MAAAVSEVLADTTLTDNNNPKVSTSKKRCLGPTSARLLGQNSAHKDA